MASALRRAPSTAGCSFSAMSTASGSVSARAVSCQPPASPPAASCRASRAGSRRRRRGVSWLPGDGSPFEAAAAPARPCPCTDGASVGCRERTRGVRGECLFVMVEVGWLVLVKGFSRGAKASMTHRGPWHALSLIQRPRTTAADRGHCPPPHHPGGMNGLRGRFNGMGGPMVVAKQQLPCVRATAVACAGAGGGRPPPQSVHGALSTRRSGADAGTNPPTTRASRAPPAAFWWPSAS